MGAGAKKARMAVKRAIQRNRAAPDMMHKATPNWFTVTRQDRHRNKGKPDTRWHCRPTGNRHHSQGEKARAKRRDIPHKTLVARRFVLFAAQEGICMICALSLAPQEATVDHIVPLFLGGDDEDGNYALVHKPCNSAKSNDEPTGCELVWMFSINARIGANPIMW